MSAAIPYLIAAVGLILSILEARLIARNRKLKRKYRQALLDLRAFYEIETRMAYEISIALDREGEFETDLAVKRRFRADVRNDGMLSPSDRATPHQIAQELAKL